tara:strand:+ start:54 stop:569 length:516 start_codon:yes stop_codon:yes gene_type:complete
MAIYTAGGNTDHLILNAKSTLMTSTFSRNSSNTDFADITGLNVEMTATHSSAKILLMVELSIEGNGGQRIGFRIKAHNNSTNADEYNDFRAPSAGSRTRSLASLAPTGGNALSHLSMNVMWTPGNTNSYTYTVQCSAEGSQPQYVNRSQSDSDSHSVYRGCSSITAMEVRA